MRISEKNNALKQEDFSQDKLCQEEVVDQVLLAITQEGTLLLIGVPAFAKDAVYGQYDCFGLGIGFKGIQFTPI